MFSKMASRGPRKTVGLKRGDSRQKEYLKDRAYQLTREKKWAEAVELLESLDTLYPPDAEVLSGLVETYYELHDLNSFQDAAERLLKIEPSNPYVVLNLAEAYITQRYPALALELFRQFLGKWPEHKEAVEVKNSIAALEQELEQILHEAGMEGKEGFNVRLQHERAQVALQQGEVEQARRLYANILKKQPDFASAHNNLAMMDALEGKLGVAIKRCEGVIKRQPDNIHALSNLVRFLCLSGKLTDAEEWGKKLRETVTDAPEELLKKAEGLAYLGDDKGVLEAFHTFESVAGKGPARLEDPLFYHLAAAASLRLDDVKAARKYWRAALKLDPDFELASANMDDLKKPAGKRHAPWYFSFPYWVTARTMLDLAEMAARIPEDLSDEIASRKAEQALANFARRHQEIEGMLPALLDRGDDASRTLAVQIGIAIGTKRSLAALKEFGLGKRGPDDLRWDALTAAGDAGLLPTAEVKVWREGKWQEQLFFGYEVYDEPADSGHSEQVIGLMADAIDAMHQNEHKMAEEFLLEALKIEPGAPDLLNNLAAVYEKTGRREEGEAMLRRIHEEHPDYLFGRVAMAMLNLREGNIEQAKELLEPLISFKRFHITEFRAFANAQIQIYIAEDNLEAARSWLEMWRSLDEDNPAVWFLSLKLGRAPRGRRRKK